MKKKGTDMVNTYICLKRFGFEGKLREQLIDILQVCVYKASEDRDRPFLGLLLASLLQLTRELRLNRKLDIEQKHVRQPSPTAKIII